METHKYNQSDKYSRIFCLMLFARVAGWRGVGDPQPEARYFLHLVTYPRLNGSRTLALSHMLSSYCLKVWN